MVHWVEHSGTPRRCPGLDQPGIPWNLDGLLNFRPDLFKPETYFGGFTGWSAEIEAKPSTKAWTSVDGLVAVLEQSTVPIE